MQTWVDAVLALGLVVSFVLHYFGKKSPAVEKVAEAVDEAEALAKQATGK